MVVSMLANWGIPRWRTIKTVHLGYHWPANYLITKVQPLAAQISVQFNVARRNYFWLTEQHSKLQRPLLAYCWHVNSTISHQFSQTANDRLKICATWEVNIQPIQLLFLRFLKYSFENDGIFNKCVIFAFKMSKTNACKKSKK